MKRRSIDARHNPCHTGIIYDVPVTRLIYRVLLDEKLPFQKFQIVSGIVQANRLSICIESFSSKFLRKKKKIFDRSRKINTGKVSRLGWNDCSRPPPLWITSTLFSTVNESIKHIVLACHVSLMLSHFRSKPERPILSSPSFPFYQRQK